MPYLWTMNEIAPSNPEYAYQPSDMFRIGKLACPKMDDGKISVWANLMCHPDTRNYSEITKAMVVNTANAHRLYRYVASNHPDIVTSRRHLFPRTVLREFNSDHPGSLEQAEAQRRLQEPTNDLQARMAEFTPEDLRSKDGMENALATSLTAAMRKGDYRSVTPLASELNKVKGHHAPKVVVQWNLNTILPAGGVPALRGECSRVLDELKQYEDGVVEADVEDITDEASTGTAGV